MLFYSKNVQVKVMAGHQIGLLADVLNDKDRGEYLLTIILTLAHDDNDDTSRMVACTVIFYFF